eukprot:6845238-Pyramimonas_sp.AAC.1
MTTSPCLKQGHPRWWRQKVVRDLEWVLTSNNLLREDIEGTPVIPNVLALYLVRESRHWLTELDENPSELLNWLAKQRNYNKLGFYFAALLEYWARFCPILNTS